MRQTPNPIWDLLILILINLILIASKNKYKKVYPELTNIYIFLWYSQYFYLEIHIN